MKLVSVAHAGRRISDTEHAAGPGLASNARLSWLQPDFVIFSSADKGIAILDLCRPSDVHADQLVTAYTGKDPAMPHSLTLCTTTKLKDEKLRSFP
jgi:hypothetical protein